MLNLKKKRENTAIFVKKNEEKMVKAELRVNKVYVLFSSAKCSSHVSPSADVTL